MNSDKELGQHGARLTNVEKDVSDLWTLALKHEIWFARAFGIMAAVNFILALGIFYFETKGHI